MAQKLFSTGPGGLRRAARKKERDCLDRTSRESLFHSETLPGVVHLALGGWNRLPDSIDFSSLYNFRKLIDIDAIDCSLLTG